MANINTAHSFIAQARAAREAGDNLQAARLAIGAQRTAKQCRARARNDVAWAAHNIIAAAQMRATEQRDRSIIGNIMAESCHIGWTF